MIEIVGCSEGPEADASAELRQKIVDAWPWAESDPNSSILLIPSAQCHGEMVRDIDIVLLAELPSDKATFQAAQGLRVKGGSSDGGGIVKVDSLCLVIELKDHSPERLRFVGPKVEVRYTRAGGGHHWKSVSDQSHNQMVALKRYLERSPETSGVPFITNLIWLRNVPRDEFPPSRHNFLPSQFTWTGLLNLVAEHNWPVREGNVVVMSSAEKARSFSISQASKLLSRRLNPTALDRARMDRIANSEVRDEWLDMLGKKQLIFEGRGGTGKTVILLGLAWRLQQERSARVLLLTYNRALVSDLTRLLALMGMSNEVGDPVIEVQTVHSFLCQLFQAIGIYDAAEEDFLESYNKLKGDALEMLREEALTRDDILKLGKESPERFDWDYICIDEAQDWPTDERDILHALYETSAFVIADGRDQFVRRDQICDWTRGDEKIPSRRVHLSMGLRMKANLARFANELASELGLQNWSIDINPKAVGGRILVVEGDYASAGDLHGLIVKDALDAGNKPVDLLTCVPPDMARGGEGKQAGVLDMYESWGHETWDGLSLTLRRTYPTSVEQMRVVQYDSCRGLEAWTVFNLAIDDFYTYKVDTWKLPPSSASGPLDTKALARQSAARWVMIPCSRAIDTLVLNTRHRGSELGRALWRVHEKCPDFVEWQKL